MITANVFDYIKTMFPKPKYHQNIWLFAINGDIGYYLIDSEVVREALRKVEPLSKKLGLNPHQVISEVINARLDVQMVNSRIVIQENIEKEFVLARSPYAEHHDLFTEAEIAIFGKEILAIPIKTEGQFKLIAGIPPIHRKAMLKTIYSHKEKITYEFELATSQIKRFYSTLINTTVEFDAGKLGAFLTGVVKELLKTNAP